MSMRDRYMMVAIGTGPSTDLQEEFGLIYSSFEEQVPQPKVIKVSIPGGSDKDITEAIGPVAFTNGVHTLKFLVYGDTEQERLDKKNAILGMLNGQYLHYSLSWDAAYTYHGRCSAEVEHKTEEADLLTLTIDRQPYKVSSTVFRDVNCHPAGTHVMEGHAKYIDVYVEPKQSATVKIDNGASQSAAANTYTLLADVLFGDHDVHILVPDWWQYIDGTNLVVNDAKITFSGTNAAFNSDWVLSGTDLVCANEAKQHATVMYQMEDF